MSNQKKAEKQLIDAPDTFPTKACKEKIARQYGKDAVALSGPRQGENLADCVCKELSSRWTSIKSRFAGDTSKVVRLALKLADSLSEKGDSDKAVAYLENTMKFEKQAATAISSYIEAYAMDSLMTADVGNMMNDIEQEDAVPSSDFGNDSPMGGDSAPMGGDAQPGMDSGLPTGDEMVELEVDAPDQGLHSGEDLQDQTSPAGDLGGDLGGVGETVSIDIPKDVADSLMDAIKTQMGGDLAQGGDLGASPDMGGSDVPPVAEGQPGEVVPGEPTDKPEGTDSQFVTGEDTEGGDDKGDCPGCTEEASGSPAAAPAAPAGPAPAPQMASGAPAPAAHAVEEKKEVGIYDELQNALDKLKGMESHKEVSSPESKPAPEKSEGEPKAEKSEPKEEPKTEDKGDDTEKKEAMSGKATKQAQADGKQIGGVELGNAKEKEIEAPKALENGNVKSEGFTAGGDKFQDGKTMKNEQKFDAKSVDKGDVSGGSSSLLGADESFPEGTPKVPAGSAPIKGEELKGGELSTKGTVIATFTPEGLLVKTPEGRKFLAKASIKSATQEMISAVSSVKYDGDGKKYASAALKAAKAASKVSVEFVDGGIKFSSPFGVEEQKVTIAGLSEEVAKKIAEISFEGDVKAFAGKVMTFLKEAKVVVAEDGVTKIDTGKLEGSNFTNDADKKPDEGGAVGAAGKKINPEEGVTKTDTSKKEDANFTNDGEKKPEGEKKASSTKAEKTASDKKVEEPKALEDGNVKSEGHTAGGDKFSDGKTMKNEQKFDAKEVKDSDVSKGSSSLMGDEQPAAKDGPKVPSQDGDLATKGTVIAETKREINPMIKEARLKAASAYVADLMLHGEISQNEYPETLEKYAQMDVGSIQALILSTKKARERVAKAAQTSAPRAQERVAGLGIPMIISSAKNEQSLKDQLEGCFKLTKDLNKIDNMPERK